MAGSISVIIPTLGRPTLIRTLSSVLRQMHVDDEIIVVADGHLDDVSDFFKDTLSPNIRYFEHGPTRQWGAAQYDYGIFQARGDWAMFLPDDDYMPAGAMDAVRTGVEGALGVHVFACLMEHWGNRVLARSKNVCEVTANQIVLRLQDAKQSTFPRWADRADVQVFDFEFLKAVLAWYRVDEPHYHDDIICVADQQNNGRAFA
jgi:glycosyltransferase involved in cell wall biosynthesis